MKKEDLLEYLEENENLNEQRTNKDSRLYKNRKPVIINGNKYPRKARVDPNYINNQFLSFLSDDTCYIFCANCEKILPISWDDLLINFDNKDFRYCKQCDKNIYRVKNYYFYQKYIKENQCIAMSINTLKFLKKDIKNDFNTLLDKIKKGYKTLIDDDEWKKLLIGEKIEMLNELYCRRE